MIVKAHILIGR